MSTWTSYLFLISHLGYVVTPFPVNGLWSRDIRVTIIAHQQAGAIGPGRLFSPGQTYGNLLWFFLVGPVVVVITYLLGRRWKAVNYLSWPVAFGAMSLVPPATGVSFSSWWVINAIFNGIIRRRKPAWWSKYSMSPRIVLRLGHLVEVDSTDVVQTMYYPLH
jgi:hypothetical protein